eukprot:TRINITY_DN686_c0_g2_i1.p1 TRINITY_DN686_c0_g2~~TRINITY_DN686_c0_g2_i1.p1  ORF type:complete len:383 (-),score=67.93 TRINITY_DN686_c0_g2_i1:163-1311(-)
MGNINSKSRKIEVNGESYKVGRVLGKGSFGKVYVLLRKDPQTKVLKTLAMKQMDKRMIIEKNVVKNILSEKSLLIELSGSSFILHILRTFQTEDDLCMIMPYMAGGDLRYHLISLHRFTEDQVRFYASQMVLGLECLHKNGIIHRDVKPDNLLVDEEGYCYIADLNVSIKAESVNKRAGTSKYMAPEVVSHQTYSFNVDWWSMGITLYELLTGKVPFDDNDAILKGELTFSRRVNMSDNAISLIKGLLNRDTEARLGAKEIKAHPFFEGVDWERLHLKQLKAPYIPDKTKAHCTPDPEFEEVFGSGKKKTWKLNAEQQTLFEGWDWEVSPSQSHSSPAFHLELSSSTDETIENQQISTRSPPQKSFSPLKKSDAGLRSSDSL